MNSRNLFLYLPALILLILCGCASTGMQGNTLPVQLNDNSQGFPRDYEVQAIVGISKQAAREDYVLAMSTQSAAFSAVFLTPQGIPVYSVHEVDGQLNVSRQTAIGELLNPRELLGYLALIYLEDSGIHRAIRDSWRWDSSENLRNFYPADAPTTATAPVRIHYRGTAPWFSRVTLTDERNKTALNIELVEAHRVLPE